MQLTPIKSGGDTPSQCSKTFKWCKWFKYLFLISYFHFKSTIKCRHYACRIPAYIVFDGRQYCLHQHNTFLPDSTKHMHLWTSYFYHILTLTVYISCLKRVLLNETIIIVQYLWRYWTIRHYHITFGLGYYTPRCPSVRLSVSNFPLCNSWNPWRISKKPDTNVYQTETMCRSNVPDGWIQGQCHT